MKVKLTKQEYQQLEELQEYILYDLFIARDRTSHLFAYNKKPELVEEWEMFHGDYYIALKPDLFPSITYFNSPVSLTDCYVEEEEVMYQQLLKEYVEHVNSTYNATTSYFYDEGTKDLEFECMGQIPCSDCIFSKDNSCMHDCSIFYSTDIQQALKEWKESE